MPSQRGTSPADKRAMPAMARASPRSRSIRDWEKEEADKQRLGTCASWVRVAEA